MTPSDIATDISGLHPVGAGNINWSTSATFCISGGQMNVADDQRTCD